ncbi:MAG: DUF488 domain-containing protein [Dehalococcoidia bacterium]|jgi:uncharacterized protein YeaO (DUF488 family)
MEIRVKRVYEQPEEQDGTRILVDRLWPRGLSKEKAKIDLWAKDLAPSNELRKWYGHEPAKWDEFKKRYFTQLDGQVDEVKKLAHTIGKNQVTFLFSSKEEKINNARALKIYMEKPRSP